MLVILECSIYNMKRNYFRKIFDFLGLCSDKQRKSASKSQRDYDFLIAHGVETQPGYVELVGEPIIHCSQGGRIVIGKGVVLVSESTWNLAGINHPVILSAEGSKASIIIRDNVGISGASIVTCSSVLIGENVMIGANSNIYGTDFHCIDAEQRRNQKQITDAPSAPVVIKPDCWLASEVTVLKGVTIGEQSVIGAKSLVNRDVPSKCLAAGVPARVIKWL